MSSLMYGLVVTMFGMIIVFLVLMGLWAILSLMKPIFSGQKKQSDNQTAVIKEMKPIIAESNTANMETEELIAVISAAISAYIGSQSNLIVRSITRVSDNTPVWGQIGRHEQTLNRL